MEKNNNTPINLRAVTVTDEFWKGKMELVRKEVIPYQWTALNDQVEGAEPSYCMRNYKLAAKIMKDKKEQGSDYKPTIYPTTGFNDLPKSKEESEDRFYGFVFQDSDFSKWIEAVAYSLTWNPDAGLEAIADEAIDIVCAAQQPNGYLDTFYIINDLSYSFTNTKDYHELYCFGHLTEGAVAYFTATGKDKLLKTVMRYADYIDTLFGVEEDKKKGYPGHEIAEMALVRLYEVTQEEKYLKLSKYFIDQRGQKPYYFDQEIEARGEENREKTFKEGNEVYRYQYYQAHRPVRKQREAVGHAVRAAYLYSGMADIARLTDDEELYQACLDLWNNIVDKKMYITGGIGATHIGEAFSFAYDLPNDTAYAETCASIGLVFFARRMIEINPNSIYADVMERALYNGILSGMALDGKSFFYVNPLEVDPVACKYDERKQHVKAVRQKWFGCACCPPNLARLISSIAAYAYTETEDTLYIHLYMGGVINKEITDSKNGKVSQAMENKRSENSQFANTQSKMITCSIESNFPYNGEVKITVSASEPTQATIALRIPGWCETYEISDVKSDKSYVESGYLYITKLFDKEEVITLNFDMKPTLMHANPLVREDVGKVAIVRGPVVYCIEEADNGKHLSLIQIEEETEGIIEQDMMIGDEKVVSLKMPCQKQQVLKQMSSLYSHEKAKFTQDMITLIPYYTWANRGEGEMTVWIRSL